MLVIGSFIGPMSGKMNGLVAARNRGGQYFREHVIPVDPQTARQINCREAMDDCWTWWSTTMTAADRRGWEIYATEMLRQGRLGHKNELPGWQAFCRQHFTRFQINQQLGAATDPGSVPPHFPAGLKDNPTITYEGTNEYAFNYTNDVDWQFDQDNMMAVYLSSPRPGTRNFFKGPYQLAAAVIGDPDDEPIFPLSINFGPTPASGERVWWRIMFTSNDRERAGPFLGDLDIP